MKKLLLIPAFVVAISGCVATPENTAAGVGFGKVLFKTAVATKCRSELNNNSIWNAAKLVLSTSKQEQIQTNVCGCVSDYAVENVTVNELAVAAIDENSRAQLVSNMVKGSINQCYRQALK